ncbi:MAG: cobyric acid synthase [Alphaproteobacteria bacterium]|nr:cobyric acid synthase [Alphaproteobacteria bacterium]
MAKSIMFQGTGSDVGKSLIVAGLCRAFSRRGLKVLPFKPQNMSNNAAVTADGGEIGRAQWLQALACGVAPTVHMNPVLLKPQSDQGAQVVVHGRVAGSCMAREYQGARKNLLGAVLHSFAILKAEADLVIVEGAGSPAEVNLRRHDIANMGFAVAANCPVVLIGDIDRGGVIASIVGTETLLEGEDREMIAGFLINKFRGDISLFDDGLKIIENISGWRSFGVVPFLPVVAKLPAEDAVALSVAPEDRAGQIHIAVPMLSRIANFDDFDPLKAEEDVFLDMVVPGRVIPGSADLIIIPGTKSTIADMLFMRAQGWDIDILSHYRQGGRILGICGGYQMLGRKLFDQAGVEGSVKSVDGLGLLAVETRLAAAKRLEQVAGIYRPLNKPVSGYEMHMGRTEGAACARPLLDLAHGPDGAISADGRVMGCYLHGLFADDDFRSAFLGDFHQRPGSGINYDGEVQRALDQLADHLESHLDLEAILAAAR